MQSTLFTTLTATEEANLSGGTHKPKKKEHKPAPAKPEPKPATPAPTITVNLPVVITQIAINVNTGDIGGDLTQTAANQIAWYKV
ncbi:hypothetical protein [Nostoc sp. CHAB 5715]|uniref:hypothetical protein n=1 Tax=Nostoc sp. CHAB 5715 TaxID=2780400 RepID=UPI001E63E9C1|nr:hypothetical protein [Nostoc sp. CHAB 5715]MCC5621759.1 hypothetical protein [Nostoc sp. CHAB 5715]